MRNKLRKRFVLICMAAYVAVVLLVLGGAFVVSTIQTNTVMDELIDLVIERDGDLSDMKHGSGDGVRKDGVQGGAQGSQNSAQGSQDSAQAGSQKCAREGSGGKGHPGERGGEGREFDGHGGMRLGGGFLTPESPFNTRFFVVDAQADGTNAQVTANSLARLSEDEMIQMAQDMISSGSQSGWADERYRYRVQKNEDGTIKAVFVDGFIQKSSAMSSLASMALVLLVLGALFFVVVVAASSRAVRPLVESYERQKQFVTDASHELKTPLTLMLTNIDIARLEAGPNDWLDDAYSEGRRMADLLSQLTKMAAMDEEAFTFQRERMGLTQMVSECVDSFSVVVQQRQLDLSSEISDNMEYSGDEAAIRQLVSTLVENAFKYVNDAGWVRVQLMSADRGSHPVLVVANSISADTEFDASRVFDRFYRADKSRTAGSGFGIGLSAAKMIAEKHGAHIDVEHVPGESVRFAIRF